jgi:ComF family protein
VLSPELRLVHDSGARTPFNCPQAVTERNRGRFEVRWPRCIATCNAAILTSCGPACRVREVVFSSSSTGFRIRAAQSQAADHELAKHGFAGWAERVAATLFFTFFPADCRICGSPLLRVSRLPVCKACLLALRPLQGSYCSVCGETLHFPAAIAKAGTDRDQNESGTRCLLCQRADPPFERAVAYGSYEGGLRDLIHVLKFQQVRPAAAVLGRLLAETIANLEQAMPVGAIVVVPVPLYTRRQAQRGFNQAEMIAKNALKRLSRLKRFELCTGVLLRRRETGSQIGLTRHQRRENLRGAFAVSDPARILNRDVLLVDDVYTTGTTASECARVLRRAGAARVWVATVARTLKITDVISLAGHLPEDTEEEGGREAEAKDRVRIAAHG